MRPVQTDNLEHLVDCEINFSHKQHFNIMKRKDCAWHIVCTSVVHDEIFSFIWISSHNVNHITVKYQACGLGNTPEVSINLDIKELTDIASVSNLMRFSHIDK